MRRAKFSRSAVRLLLVLSLLLLLGLPQSLLAAENRDALQRAIGAQERLNAQLLGKPGVLGTGIGLNPAGKAVIQVYALHGSVAGIPRSADSVAVQRVVTGLITARSCQTDGDPTKRCDRPVPIGVSVGHPSITAGTIGARVKNASGQLFALSNNHVLANSNNAGIGDPALQPGSYDGGTLADSIGTLADFQPISFGSGTTNQMDAAIALSSTANLGAATLPYGYGVPGTSPVSASVNMSVQKCGRTTKCTTGSVAQTNVTVDVCYKPQGPFFCARDGIARFVNQFSVTPGNFSAGGDSGSLIVTNNSQKNPVGLLFAGSSTHTFANPIGPVLTRFGVSIDNSTGTSPTPTPTPTPTATPTEEPTATPTEEPTATPTAPEGLTASAKPQGNARIDLGWSGGASTVDILRAGPVGDLVLIATTSNSGSYRDVLGRNPPSGTYRYRVCNSGTEVCSDDASAVIP